MYKTHSDLIPQLLSLLSKLLELAHLEMTFNLCPLTSLTLLDTCRDFLLNIQYLCMTE